MATDEMLSFQDNVWSKRYECNCAIGELSSHAPPLYFMNSTWVRWREWVFDDLLALILGLTLLSELFQRLCWWLYQRVSLRRSIQNDN